MMTSRSEYRLLLRQDNADLRLTPKGHKIGLISDERYAKFLAKKEAIEKEIARAQATVIPPSDEVNALLESVNSSPIKSGVHLSELIKRPELDYKILAPIDKDRPKLNKYVEEQAYIQIKYEGYIQKQLDQVEQFKKLENKKIPDGIDFSQIHGLRLEARQKLAKFKPHSIGQASRISGVSPSDINVLLIYLSH